MKRQILKKLTLGKETLRILSEREMRGANGGATRFCQTSDPCYTEETGCTGSCPGSYTC